MADRDDSLFTELSRRNVFRVGIAYVVASWLLLQVVDVLADILELPEWVPKFFLVILAVGFVLAVIFAWAYEMTPEGLKREKDVDRSRSITDETGKRLDRITIAIVVLAVGVLVTDRYLLPTQQDTPPTTPAIEQTVDERIPSIAVLPFANMSADESSGYFSDGLADTLLHMLAQISELRVAARTSSFQFRDQNIDIRDIGSQLQVSSVLEGSVQRAGNKIRVTAQLINVDDGYHLWSGNFDRELDDIFAIQDEIAHEVVRALQVSLLGSEVERLQMRSTDNVDAYTEYMLGIDAMDQFSFESLPRAEQHFKRAIELDPDYAIAHARLAQSYIEMFDTGLIGYDQLIEDVAPVIDRAVALDPDEPIAITLQGAILSIRNKDEMAEVILRRAIRVGPNEVLPKLVLARILQNLDRETEALEIIEQSLKNDPLSTRALGRAASINGDLGNYAEARAAAQRIQKIDPESPTGYYYQAFADWDDDRPASAIRMMQRSIEADPLDPELAVQIGDWYLDVGDFEVTDFWYRQAVSIDPNHPLSQTAPLYLEVIRGTYDIKTIERAQELLGADIDNRKGSRDLLLDILFLDGHARGDYTEYLQRMEIDYPEFFDDPPAMPAEAFPEQGSRVAFSMMQSGEIDAGRQLAEYMVEQLGLPGRNFEGSLQGFNVAALTGNEAVINETLKTKRKFMQFFDSWNTAQHLFPWLGDYASHPEYVAILEELKTLAADRLARIEAELGKPPYDEQKGAPPK